MRRGEGEEGRRGLGKLGEVRGTGAGLEEAWEREELKRGDGEEVEGRRKREGVERMTWDGKMGRETVEMRRG